jgi:carbon storage regulator CsrA
MNHLRGRHGRIQRGLLHAHPRPEDAQEIRIADEIWIKVLRIHRDSVKLGIVAPDDITIIREELIQPEPSMSDKIAENVDAIP